MKITGIITQPLRMQLLRIEVIPRVNGPGGMGKRLSVQRRKSSNVSELKCKKACKRKGRLFFWL